jgi:hypothetical protein
MLTHLTRFVNSDAKAPITGNLRLPVMGNYLSKPILDGTRK